jgi:hypothetical protein
MQDPVRHVVVDANTLGAFLYANSTGSANLQQRSQVLLGAAIQGQWPGIKLYTPAICIAEALGVLDKYHFCTWHGPAKNDPSKRLSAMAYEAARDLLIGAVRSRTIEQLEHEPGHVLLAGLVSPVNQNYQIRRKDRRGSKAGVKPPMGATDCLIAGMTIHLVSRMGREAVVLATADQRLADVLKKAERIKQVRAVELGLVEVANQAGLTWGSKLYPSVVNLHKATPRQLRDAFGGWPLPTTPVVTKRRGTLTPQEATTLEDTWVEVAGEYGITDPERLAYSLTLDDLKTRFAVAARVCLSNEDIFRFLLQRRKAGQLRRP